MKLLVFAVLLFSPIAAQAQVATILESTAAMRTAKLLRVQLDTGVALNASLLAGQRSGILESPPIARRLFDRAVISWNAITPNGTWLELAVRARVGSNWSRYYRIAKWSTDPRLERRSFAGERDANGSLETDTLKLTRAGNAVQIRVTFNTSVTGETPTLRRLAVSSFDSRTAYRVNQEPSDRRAWGVDIAVPVRSQMIYPNGGEVWCSPTTVTMLLEYWGIKLKRTLAERVPKAVNAIWDKVYDGGGNWVLNTAYVGSKGLKAYVDRLSSLSQAEAFIRRGLPLVVSINWKLGTLRGAKLPTSSGHILLLRGFTKNGDPITNDPAGKRETQADIVTVYDRAEFERAWIEHSGGIVYVVQP